MSWEIEFEDAFEREFDALDEAVQDKALAMFGLLAEFGPTLGRPRADTLNGSAFGNMKELRFDAGDGVWRVAFAFDPDQRGILLVASDKAGANERRFYRLLIAVADERYRAHLKSRKGG